MKLADEIRAIGFSDHCLNYRDGALAMQEACAQLVENREAERAEKNKDCIKVKIRRETQQVFIIERAPECKPLSIQEVSIGLDMFRQDSEWDVREVIPVTESEA